MSYSLALVRDIQRAAKRVKLGKSVNPHNFRHSRATFMANHFTEAQMSQWFGWVTGSRMPVRYVHLSGRDIDKDYAILHGIEGEEKSKPELLPKTCMRCELEKIPPESKFCPRCGAPLDTKTAMEIEQSENKLMSAFAKLGDEDVMSMLEVTSKLYQMAKEDSEVAEKLKKVENSIS